jgi:hypothetical protein
MILPNGCRGIVLVFVLSAATRFATAAPPCLHAPVTLDRSHATSIAPNEGLTSEVRRQLVAAGLPLPSAPNRPCLAATVNIYWRQRLESVNWREAVRAGARNATVRGFGGSRHALPETITERQLRTAVRNCFVESMNYVGAKGGQVDRQRLQNLIAAGVEDAIVEAFNRSRVAEGSEDGEHHSAPQRRPHYGGGLDGEEFTERYGQTRIVASGWIVTEQTALPLAGGEFALLPVKRRQGRAEVWQHGQCLFDNVQFFEFYEDVKLYLATADSGPS